MNPGRFWTLTAMVALAAASRLAPHPWNVTPTAAIALFGAATFARKREAVLVPLLALVLSDALMQITMMAGWQPHPGFYAGQWAVYACTLASVGFGLLLRRRRTVPAVATATLASALVFFLATNFVYFYGEDSLYPRTLAGMADCYVQALPFLRNSLIGDFAYVAIMFGALAAVEAKFPALRRHEKPTLSALTDL